MTVYAVPKPIKVEKKKTFKRIKRVRDTELSKLIDKCDILCRGIIKIKAGFKCQAILENGERCNRAPVEDHHIIERAKSLITRISLEDHIAFCSRHHDHDHKGEMDDTIKRTIGLEKWDSLHEIWGFPVLGLSRQEYVEEQLKKLTEELKQVMLRR